MLSTASGITTMPNDPSHALLFTGRSTMPPIIAGLNCPSTGFIVTPLVSCIARAQVPSDLLAPPIGPAHDFPDQGTLGFRVRVAPIAVLLSECTLEALVSLGLVGVCPQ